MAYSDDEQLNSEYLSLCCAVGNLFLTFSRLESVMSQILRLHLANNFADHKDEHETVAFSSAIYGSLRFKAARDTMQRIRKAENATSPADDFFTQFFSHLGEIEALRDRLAHQTVIRIPDEHLTPDGDWQISNQASTRDLKNIQIWIFHTSAVLAAANDLVIATDFLGNQSVGRTLFESHQTSPLPWQYKPSMLKLVPLGTARTRL